MSDIVERLRAITTEAAERLAKWCGTRLPTIADALRSLAAERDALQAENGLLRQALVQARQCIDADDVIGAHAIITAALGEKQ